MDSDTRKTDTRWVEFQKLTEDEKIQKINNLMIETPKITVKDFAQQNFGVAQSTFSSHLSDMGYEKIKGQYIKKRNKNISEENKMNKNKTKVSDSNKNITLEMYSNINNALCQIENDELDTVTMKMPKELHDQLKEFLKAHKILKKQDVLAVAIADFLNRYSN